MVPQSLDDVRDDILVDILAPDDIQMLIASQWNRSRMRRQLVEHLLNVHKGVAVAVEEDDGRDNVPGGETCGSIGTHAGRAARRTRDNEGLDIVIVHLELAVAHDLEPVHDGLDRSEGVEMSVRGVFLGRRDVTTAPVEEPAERAVDDVGEDRRVEDGLPTVGGG